MKNRKTRSAMRRMLFTLALVLVVAVASVGGTIAWLTDKTDAVTNTFTVGDINIELKETLKPDGTTLAPNEKWEAKLIPGTTYAKDPVVTVKANSEECYLFVKFEEINNPSNYLEYSSNLKGPEWTQLDQDANKNVWYKVVESRTNDQSWNLLAGDESNDKFVNGKVTVRNTIVKSGTTDTTAPVMPTNEKAPQLKYTAYAIQTANTGSALEAWNKISK